MNFWKSKLNSVTLCPKHIILMGYKYKVDHNYFKKIDDEYKAYILGFIYADGCVSQPVGNRQLNFRIGVQEEDSYILNNLSIDAAGGQIHTVKTPSSISRGYRPQVCVNVSSNILGQDLIDLGCSIRKSREGMKFPNISTEMIPHFIRGFMDGDGSIIIKPLGYKYKRKTTWTVSNAHSQQYKLKVAFCSTDKQFLEKIVEYLPISKSYIAEKKRTQIVYILWIENSQDVQDCLNYLYKNATYFLKRKRDKFEEFNKTIKSQAEDESSEGLETT